MPVTEVVMGLGSWSVQLVDAPRELTDRLQYFGHIAIIPGRVRPAEYGDQLLRMARYVGVLTKREQGEQQLTIAGQGMNFWLGDGDDKGEILENPVTIKNQTFANSIRAILGSSTAVVEGVLHSVPGTYNGRHQWESKRKAIAYICEVFGAEYRVNGDGTLDAGTQAQLYRVTPTCVIVRKGAEGRDLSLTGLPGDMQLTQDVEDFTTRVVLLAEGEGESIATGTANISFNPYRDLRGQPVQRTRIISESGTATGNAQARAQLQLNRFTGTRNALRLSTSEYIVDGSFVPGDNVYVYDPDAGLYDLDVEITFRGNRINPIVLRAVEASWPVTEGMTVAYRHQDGTWYDLTDYVRWESGQTTIGVGSLGRRLTSTEFEPVGPRPVVDSTIPGQVAWVLPFQTSSYVDAEGNTRASMLLTWQTPLNEDGSTILDGDHYEIQYRVSSGSEWQTEYAPWGATSTIINDLSPGVAYDFRIRLVDTSGHAGEWSAVETAVASPDTIPPSTPAPPTVAASPLALQIRHELGRADGGTFNLELDLDHLEIHVGTTSSFTPDETTLAGRAPANAGMIQAQIPAVATVEVPDGAPRWVRVIAVDRAGNKSAPSVAVSASALLLGDAHITELTVDKIAAGTIRSNWLIGASIRTADSGQRVELNAAGLHGYNSAGTELVTLSNTGSFLLRSASSGARVELDSNGLRITDTSGNQLVSLGSNGNFVIRSSASGARVELDTSGLRLIGSTGVPLVDLNDSGTFTIRSGTSGARVELDTSGLRLINASGATLVDLNGAGTFTLRSGTSGARVELDNTGFRAFNSSGTQTVNISTSTGEVDIQGRFSSGPSGKRLVINPLFNAAPEIRLYEDSTNYHFWTSHVVGSLPTFQLGSAYTTGQFKGLLNVSGEDFTLATVQDPNSVVNGPRLSGNRISRSLIMEVTGGGGFSVTGNSVQLIGRLGVGSSQSAVAAGFVTVSGTAGTIFYGVTYAGTPYPAAMVRAGNNAAFNITHVTTNAFAWVWGGPTLTSGIDHINWFARVE